ncbi:polysaccharide deacetylase family protein [Microlunatus flavus]|uniref:Peptidoglycan/xylan/chitin deacetylase, PgdA/CDA1 family n=1 Tax=Microlunatus flavus TaxID=1036181 RepID=A0A1H9G0D4_9ACTN|nr:polysaccharide deacetylase family protein [Microlunatus flavus]SEQ43625.1 Peptidoglycan/xylan/chitin deacetylase, PgdA/CDA1 family [Microlunatus flavus]
MGAAAGGSVLGLSAAVGLAWWAGFGSRTQLWGPFPYRAPTPDEASSHRPAVHDKVVALTFDDGPNEPWTGRLLDVLAAKDVRATFFQVGRCAERFPSATRRVVDEGHVLGNHSLNHAFTSYLHQPAQQAEVARAQEVLHRISGVVPALYRPPWLCHWPWVLRTVERAGLQVVSGTFCHQLEVFQPPARSIAAEAARRVRPGTILIMHDGRDATGGDRSQTVAAVAPLVDRLRDEGYTFTTVDRLLGVPATLG